MVSEFHSDHRLVLKELFYIFRPRFGPCFELFIREILPYKQELCIQPDSDDLILRGGKRSISKDDFKMVWASWLNQNKPNERSPSVSERASCFF